MSERAISDAAAAADIDHLADGISDAINDSLEVVETPEETARKWSDFLSKLVPPHTVEVVDITGAIHRLRANLPAAVETRIMRRLQGIKLPDMNEVISDVRTAGDSKDIQSVLGSVMDGALSIVGDEETVQVVADCFAIAHPKAMRAALANVKSDEDASEYLPEGAPTAVDLFSLTDIVSGVIPFALRAVSRIGTTAATLLHQKT